MYYSSQIACGHNFVDRVGRSPHVEGFLVIIIADYLQHHGTLSRRNETKFIQAHKRLLFIPAYLTSIT